jgi:RHS repeat-associated protein
MTMTQSAICASDVHFVPPHSTGKERDTESGNDYFEARYYSSAMGRFMSPDWGPFPMPVPFALRENPQSLNLYNYVLNNPLKSVDPHGHYHWRVAQVPE